MINVYSPAVVTEEEKSSYDEYQKYHTKCRTDG